MQTVGFMDFIGNSGNQSTTAKVAIIPWSSCSRLWQWSM
jgi:hypothetical protein